jgi:hypothetical protein
MKRNFCILIFAALLVGSCECFSQGFINLDFESAKIIRDPDSPYYPYGIASTNALPGWTVYIGSSPASAITFNAPAIESTWVMLWATNGAQIAGNYSVFLQGGISDSSATISQTGLVPASAVSLLFEAQAGQNILQVSLGGQNLFFLPIGTGSNYTLYGASLPTGIAGQTESLSFAALQGLHNDWNIDNIQFSTTAVPEPSQFGLVTLSGLFLGLRRWKILSR